MIIVLLPGSFVSFTSLRTGETLLELHRPGGELVAYGHATRDRYKVWLDGDVVKIDGTLRDRVAPAVSFGDGAMRFHTRVIVDCGVLADDDDNRSAEPWRVGSAGAAAEPNG